MKLIDVSNVNGAIDWRAVANAGVKGAFVKATEGRTYTDSEFTTNRRRANAAGVAVGAYHFARPDRNAAASEAANFCVAVKSLGPRDLRPVLDYEHKVSLSPAAQAQWIRSFNAVVRDHLGVWPMFYTYPALLSSLRATKPFGNGLWLASYGLNDGADHGFVVPSPWRKVAIHQFTSRGRVPGIHGYVDLDWTGSLPYARPVKQLLGGGGPSRAV